MSSPALAQTVWVGPPDGDWFDPGNWSPLGVPTASTEVAISSGPVVIDTAGAQSGAAAIDSTGRMRVVGPGSWTTDTLHLIGGRIELEEGVLQSNLSFIDDGSIDVAGSGSHFSTLTDLVIGRGSGPASIAVGDGGQLSASRSFIGEGDNAAAATSLAATVTGAGSLWNAGSFFAVGGRATVVAELTISDGGAMIANGNGVIGRGGLGAATVTGADSELRVNNGASLTIGEFFNGHLGQGSLTIEDGGLVVAAAVRVGSDADSTGALGVNGVPGAEGVLLTARLSKGAGGAAVEFDGGVLRASADSATFIQGFADGDVVIQPGRMFVDSNGFTVTASSPLTGAGALTKLGAGTLILTGANSYAGGTTITDGVLQLGDGGASGAIVGDVVDNGVLAFNRSDAVTFGGAISGAGGVHQIGSGSTLLTANSSGLTGVSQVQAGVLSVDGVLGGAMEVRGGRLQGAGQVGDTLNFTGGTIAPGNSIDTLTVAGNYAGADGMLEIEAVLGGDSSPSDRLVVTGDTSGATIVRVINLGGAGAQTIEGVKIVDVGGASNGTFSLAGDYLFEGQPAIVAGAYGYRLYKNGVASPADGDWYLRSALLSPEDEAAAPAPPAVPLYQPGAPIYEAYAAVLQSFNGLDTLQRRIGNRSWTEAADADSPADAGGVWARAIGGHLEVDPKSSTTSAQYDSDAWQLQAGVDGLLYDGEAGRLIGGLSARYGEISADVSSVFGDGSITVAGYGVGGALTWYGAGGFYLDSQASLTWYGSDLSSATAGAGLVSGHESFGYALGVEAGRRIAVGSRWSITPQAQLAYSEIDYDPFTDAFGAAVSLAEGDSLRARLGLSADYQDAWTDTSGEVSRIHAYGVVNLHHEFLPDTQVDLAEARLASRIDSLAGGVGVGGTYSWRGGRYRLHGELTLNTSLNHFGENYDAAGTAGLSVRF